MLSSAEYREYHGGRREEDPVNHPKHYELAGGIECFDVILATQGVDAAKGFCAGNVLKYMYRAPKKNGTEDHKKARWYLDKLIELEEELWSHGQAQEEEGRQEGGGSSQDAS